MRQTRCMEWQLTLERVALLDRTSGEIAEMKASTNIVGWLRLFLFASGAVYLWRSALLPRNGEPKGRFDRGLRIFGGLLLSALVIYLVGFGLGLYGSR